MKGGAQQIDDLFLPNLKRNVRVLNNGNGMGQFFPDQPLRRLQFTPKCRRISQYPT